MADTSQRVWVRVTDELLINIDFLAKVMYKSGDLYVVIICSFGAGIAASNNNAVQVVKFDTTEEAGEAFNAIHRAIKSRATVVDTRAFDADITPALDVSPGDTIAITGVAFTAEPIEVVINDIICPVTVISDTAGTFIAPTGDQLATYAAVVRRVNSQYAITVPGAVAYAQLET